MASTQPTLRPRPHSLTISRSVAILLLAALTILAACMPTAAAADTPPATAVSSDSLSADLTSADPAGDVTGYAPAAAPAPPVQIHPGDIVAEHVVIDSLEPVPAAVAFADLVAGRRLRNAGCRKCRCLPRCSRCRINKCRDGLCSGLCRLPAPKQRCTILRCATDRSNPAF